MGGVLLVPALLGLCRPLGSQSTSALESAFILREVKGSLVIWERTHLQMFTNGLMPPLLASCDVRN